MTAPTTVRCKCSHAKSQHTRSEGQCWATVCGCRYYQPDEKPPPEDRCEFSDLPVSGCAHCRGTSTAAVAATIRYAADEVGPVFVAFYESRCASCDAHIRPGDPIAAVKDETTVDGRRAYACQECQP